MNPYEIDDELTCPYCGGWKDDHAYDCPIRPPRRQTNVREYIRDMKRREEENEERW